MSFEEGLDEMRNENYNNGGDEPASITEDVGRLVRKAGPRPTMSDAAVERMQGDLRPLWQSEVERHAPTHPRFRLVAAAALVAVAIAAVFFTRTVLRNDSELFASVVRVHGSVSAWGIGGSEAAELLDQSSVIETGLSIATAGDARAAFATATGHSLRLDHDTRIVLVSRNEVRLEQGAIYVDSGIDSTSHSNAREGLNVLTAFGTVQEIGTQFEVRLTADLMKVRVREGEVSIGAEGREERGVAGEELAFSGGTVRRGLIDAHDKAFGWTQSIAPEWTMDGSRLEAFLAWAARESGYRLEYAEDELAGEAATVVLSGEVAGLSPRQALEVVLPAVGLRHRLDDGALQISRLSSQD